MLSNAEKTRIHTWRAQPNPAHARGQCLRILDHIRECGGDWSIGELAQALEMDKSAVSARVNELLNAGRELVARPRRKDRVSGVLVRPVGLPTYQVVIAPRGVAG